MKMTKKIIVKILNRRDIKPTHKLILIAMLIAENQTIKDAEIGEMINGNPDTIRTYLVDLRSKGYIKGQSRGNKRKMWLVPPRDTRYEW